MSTPYATALMLNGALNSLLVRFVCHEKGEALDCATKLRSRMFAGVMYAL
jgi:hypothetical protein